ncbi:MAG: hypothetical protein GX330_07355 [Bacteroidales bacterium]|nr:hypothetical protein [Bacteroidales bacterium]
MMNIRKLLNYNDGYYMINREERNLAAIFYHILLTGNNLTQFINTIGSDFLITDNELGIYLEYAYIRDLWNNIKQGNDFKRKLILDLLQPSNRQELENLTIFDFNDYFGAKRALSSKNIVSPSNWSIANYDKNIPDNDDFLKVCKFKWCFNAKPDIVIHTSHNTAICIEAKFESIEGIYPSKSIEKTIFNRRKISNIGQLSIQKHLMEEILGVKTEYIFLIQKKSSSHIYNGKHKIVLWKEAFANLEISDCPNFIKECIKRLDNAD